MTDFRALCAELHAALDRHDLTLAEDQLLDRSAAALRAALADEPAVPEGREPATWTEGVCGDGAALLKDGVMVPIEAVVRELNEGARARAALANEPAVPSALVDTHYEWELEDAAGEWQAGGSSNSQSDVEREGMRYLQTYAQDGPHKLIIRQHTTQTINEIANDH